MNFVLSYLNFNNLRSSFIFKIGVIAKNNNKYERIFIINGKFNSNINNKYNGKIIV